MDSLEACLRDIKSAYSHHITHETSKGWRRVCFSQPSQAVPVSSPIVWASVSYMSPHLLILFEGMQTIYSVHLASSSSVDCGLDQLIQSRMNYKATLAGQSIDRRTARDKPTNLDCFARTSSVTQERDLVKHDEFTRQGRIPFSQMLMYMFDSADEDSLGYLRHKEVSDLLQAAVTDYGLKSFDSRQLMVLAKEAASGSIDYLPFVQTIPDVVESILNRRLTSSNDTHFFDDGPRFDRELQVLPGRYRQYLEAVELCYNHELELISKRIMDACLELVKSRATTTHNVLPRLP